MEEKLTNPEDNNITSAVAALLALPAKSELPLPHPLSSALTSSSASTSLASDSAAHINQPIAQAAWLWKDPRSSFRDLPRQGDHQDQQHHHHHHHSHNHNHHQQLVNHHHHHQEQQQQQHHQLLLQQVHHLFPQTSQLTSASAQASTTTTSSTSTTISSPPSFINLINDFILQYVNLNIVRKMIAQNLIEILFICVIITYLVFYFSQISRVSNRYDLI